MARRRRRAWVVACALALGAAGACFDFDYDDHDEERARRLDSSCPCATEGVARVTSGPTADSTGIVVGPGRGRVTIPLPEVIDASQLAVLARGEGRVVTRILSGQGCLAFPQPCVPSPSSSAPGDPVPAEYDWLPMWVPPLDGGRNDLVVETFGAGDRVDIADLRFDEDPDPDGCSVSAPGRRRRR